jgi:hypothetical protein
MPRGEDEPITHEVGHLGKRLEMVALVLSREPGRASAMLRAVYARVEVRGEQFTAADLTSDAKELGLIAALPEAPAGRARQASDPP